IRSYADDVARAWGVEGFGVRVGVATGPVVVGPVGAGRRVEYGAFGDTVNVAARLQASAEPGTALADADTHRLAEPLFDWGPPERLTLKGKSQPVLARRVRGVQGDAAALRGLRGEQAPLVGRDRELATATAVLQGALQGAGGILFLSGEAGIGKSRLLNELHATAEGASRGAERPPRWLNGRCVSYGEALPYWPYRDLVRGWLGAGL